MTEKDFKALEQHLTEFAEQDKENNSVLIIIGYKDGQRIQRVGKWLNLATCLSCAMNSDDYTADIVKAAVDAYDNVILPDKNRCND